MTITASEFVIQSSVAWNKNCFVEVKISNVDIGKNV